MNLKQINRIKVVLVEQNRISKWHSEQCNVLSTTVFLIGEEVPINLTFKH